MTEPVTHRATWEIVQEAAEHLSAQGDGTFRLRDIIDYVQAVDTTRARSSIQPVVQGMTTNAGKGPASRSGQVLRRVQHGLYRLDRTPARPAVRVAAKGTPATRATAVPLETRLADLTSQFDHFVDRYDRSPPFRRVGQLENHQATIAMRRRLGSVRAAVEDMAFLHELRATLYSWGIGKRASRVVDVHQMHRSLVDHLPDLRAIEHLTIEGLGEPETENVASRIHQLIAELDIVENEARIVAGTKTLHHLLPDLVPPMDRAWTGKFFGWSPTDAQYRQERTFLRTYTALARVARATTPSRLVGRGWRTSSTKVIDNAVVGYCMENGLSK